MICKKVSAVYVLLFCVLNLLFSESSLESIRIECIPIKHCPMAMDLIKTKPYAPDTIKLLRFSHCGFDDEDNGAKIWCSLFDFCTTPDSRNGTCQNINDCDSFTRYMNNSNYNEPKVKKYLRAFRCSTESDPEIKICCLDGQSFTSSINNYENIPSTTEQVITKTIPEISNSQTGQSLGTTNRVSDRLPNPDLQECGQQELDNRIFGGKVAGLNEYPWLALLKYRKQNKMDYACSGVLINREYILTAAHCIDPKILKAKNLGKLQNIILGEYDTRNVTDCIYQKYGTDCADPPQIFSPRNYVIHPSYNSSTMVNDIALIRLNKKAFFSSYVQPICLPPPDLKLKINETLMISGWGRTETEKSSSLKRKTQLKNVDLKNCNKFNGVRKLNGRQICVGEGKGVDSCYGDSGGPLMVQKKVRKGYAFFTVGIVSYGYGRICGGFPGVYTYVPPFLTWIFKQIG